MPLRLTLTVILMAIGWVIPSRASATSPCRTTEDRTGNKVVIYVVFNGAPYLQNEGKKRQCDVGDPVAVMAFEEYQQGKITTDYRYGEFRRPPAIRGPGYKLMFRITDGQPECALSPEYAAFFTTIALYFDATSARREYYQTLDLLSNVIAVGWCREFQQSLAYRDADALLKDRRR
jgi:hypothetical protein